MSNNVMCKTCNNTKGAFNGFSSRYNKDLSGWYCNGKCYSDVIAKDQSSCSKCVKCRNCGYAKLLSQMSSESAFTCKKCHDSKIVSDEFYCCSICHEYIEKYNTMGEEDKNAKYGKCYVCLVEEDKCVDCNKPRNKGGSCWRCKDCLPKFHKSKRNYVDQKPVPRKTQAFIDPFDD